MTIKETMTRWAEQSKPAGQCGNVKFVGGMLYSYAEPIALHLPNGQIAVATEHWSLSTSRHQSLAYYAAERARLAVPLRVYAVGEMERVKLRSMDRSAVLESALKRCGPKAKKARVRLREEADRVCAQYYAYCSAFGNP